MSVGHVAEFNRIKRETGEWGPAIAVAKAVEQLIDEMTDGDPNHLSIIEARSRLQVYLRLALGGGA